MATPDLMQQMGDTKASVSKRVYAVVLDDPGVSCRHISDRLGLSGRQVSQSLAFLRRTGRVQNRGKHAKGASWYPVG